uniref:U5 small nuclear ribonucleoprotein TSSC4 n=3 Tax=Rhodnius TaxID=13248 RepID=T1I1G2_RHOPR
MKMYIPEFIKNPHKWKKYSLGDDEISDDSNRMVAMNFLKTLKKRMPSEESTEICNYRVKPTFNKFLKKEGKELAVSSGVNAKPTFLNGKTIMPEYVVGQKVFKVSKKKEQPTVSNSCVKLDHLLEDE